MAAEQSRRTTLFTIETLKSPTGASLRLYTAAAAEPARGGVMILHGLAEHAGRYETFAGHLAERGFHVFAHDHRGHGHTSAPDAPFRRFAGRDGRRAVLADVAAIQAEIRRRHPSLPLVVFGHSMGGLIALDHAGGHGGDLAGVAAWNCDANPGPGERIAPAVLALERWLKGSDAASSLMQRATFDLWARSIPNRTGEYDWLSGDPETLASYGTDPLCGFSPTISMWRDVVRFILEGGSDRGLERIPRTLPIHLLGGGEDPCTRQGAALRKLADRLEGMGGGQVSFERIEGARHETLFERPAQREAALASLDRFLDRIAPRSTG